MTKGQPFDIPVILFWNISGFFPLELDKNAKTKYGISSFFRVSQKLANIVKMCRIFNLYQSFFGDLKSFLQKIIQCIISAYNVFNNLRFKDIAKKAKIISSRKLPDIRYVFGNLEGQQRLCSSQDFSNMHDVLMYSEHQ